MLTVANRFLIGIAEPIVVLQLDVDKCSAEVVFEAPAPVGETDSPAELETVLFPHIYGPLNMEAVSDSWLATRATDGAFVNMAKPAEA